jgi:WS/DGAT/MGAT family acyltransferase
MARPFYEPLSLESAAYLEAERSRRRQHVTMIAVFDAGPLATAEGGVDFDRIREIVAMRVAELPRLRMKLRRVPLDGHPVWIDDPEFHLEYHLQQSSLPRPGSHAQLCRTTARIAARRLDRSRPLWDCWILEGLEGGRFALVLKMHKALASLEGADLLRALLSPSAARVAGRARPTPAQPAPSPIELFAEEVVRGLGPSRRALGEGLRTLRRPRRALAQAQRRAHAILHWMGYRLRPTGESPFDGELGPHRSFAIRSVDLETVQAIRRTFGGSVHDGVLTLLAGALRRFVADRRINPVSVDLRAVTPILAADGMRARSWTIELPVWEDDPAQRHAIVREQTRRIRVEEDVAMGDAITDTVEWNASRLFAIGARALRRIDTGHIGVLQSPGPQQALFLDGAELRECYGIFPLQDHSGLGVTVLGYAGRLFFAFNADTNRVPDFDRLAEALDEEIEAIGRVAQSDRPALRAVAGGGASAWRGRPLSGPRPTRAD